MSRWGEEEPGSRPGPGAFPAGLDPWPDSDLPVAAGPPPLASAGAVVARLVGYVAVTLLVGVGVIVGARFLGAGFRPAPTLVVAAAAGVLWWAVAMVSEWPPYERWEPAAAVDPSLRVASDPRTRRLESMLSGADARHRMSTRDLARTLSAVVCDTLVRTYGADPADPLAAATGRLSPRLIEFLRADPNTPAPALTRRVLHSWLTEIDTLTRQRG